MNIKNEKSGAPSARGLAPPAPAAPAAAIHLPARRAAPKLPTVCILPPRSLPDTFTGGKRSREIDADGFARPYKRRRTGELSQSGKQEAVQPSSCSAAASRNCWITLSDFRRLDTRGRRMLCALASILMLAKAWHTCPLLQFEDAEHDQRLLPPLRCAGADPAWERPCGVGAWFGSEELFQKAWDDGDLNRYVEDALAFCKRKLPLLASREARDALRFKLARQATLILIQACRGMGELVQARPDRVHAGGTRVRRAREPAGPLTLLLPDTASTPTRLAMQAFQRAFPVVLRYCQAVAGCDGTGADYFGASPSFIARLLGMSKAQWEQQLLAPEVFTLVRSEVKTGGRDLRPASQAKLLEQARAKVQLARISQVKLIMEELTRVQDDDT